MKALKVAAALCLAAAAHATDDAARLDIQFGITGDGVCDLALDHTDEVRSIVAKNIKVNGATLSDKDIVYYDVAGCNARRRRKVLGATATITVGFSTASPAVAGLDADAFYDAATESLKEAISTITSDFESSCGCTVNVDTIKVELSTLVVEEAAVEAPERDLGQVYHNTGNQILAKKLPAPASTYYAGADCPNSCSGHGSCSTNGCVCWPNWGNGDESGGACDQRICPYEIAWADTPSAENKAHALRECAGRGICDRSTGDCQCFPGYDGKGCRRTTCPNDCSGHGECKFISEFRNDLGDNFKRTGDKPTLDQYAYEFPLMWDAYKTRGCLCDAKWTGMDCSIRMCPRGDYPQYFALEKQPETQAVIITNVFTAGNDGGSDTGYKTYASSDATNGEFALTFRSTLNEEFSTTTLNVYNLTEEMVEDALNSLPNKVIEDATVTLYRNLSKYNQTNYRRMDIQHGDDDPTGRKHYKLNYPYIEPQFNYTWYDTDLVLLVTYNGAMTSGDQYALECKTEYCADGCQPKLEFALDLKKSASCYVINNYEAAIATNWECSGRGECGSDGVCACYQGYTDEYCSTRTAII